MTEGDARYRYSVAWVDCMTRGAHLGRAILTRGDHASAGDVDGASLAAPRGAAPRGPLGRAERPAQRADRARVQRGRGSARRRATRSPSPSPCRRSSTRSTACATGTASTAGAASCSTSSACPTPRARPSRAAIERLSGSRVPSFLAVLKRFGPGEPRPAVVPGARLDPRARPARRARRAARGPRRARRAGPGRVGGRIYFAKDARLDPSQGRARCTRAWTTSSRSSAASTPRARMTSDLARRLALTGG